MAETLQIVDGLGEACHQELENFDSGLVVVRVVGGRQGEADAGLPDVFTTVQRRQVLRLFLKRNKT